MSNPWWWWCGIKRCGTWLCGVIKMRWLFPRSREEERMKRGGMRKSGGMSRWRKWKSFLLSSLFFSNDYYHRLMKNQSCWQKQIEVKWFSTTLSMLLFRLNLQRDKLERFVIGGNLNHRTRCVYFDVDVLSFRWLNKNPRMKERDEVFESMR